MTSKNQRDSVSLNVVIGAAIVVWASTFAYVFGPFVFGYIAMHLATTGIFVMAIRRTDRKYARRTARPALATATSSSIRQPKVERRASPQPAA